MRTDVTAPVGVGDELETVTTVYVPDPLPATPILCFALPGGGYSRRYFATDPYERATRGQAEWHVRHGWIFAATDYLGSRESSHPRDPGALSFEHLTTAVDVTVRDVVECLRTGALVAGLGPADPFTIGIGQSFGGGLAVLTQGQHNTFDTVGVLGFSARHAQPWMPPGVTFEDRTYIPRGVNVTTLSEDAFLAAVPETATDDDGLSLSAPGFYSDDVPKDLVRADLIDYPMRRGDMPEWGSATVPPCGLTIMSPGAISCEAASIRCPVFLAFGERDNAADPRAEPSAYRSSPDVSLFICPQMAHMHNFASTRKRLWGRLQSWGRRTAATAGLALER